MCFFGTLNPSPQLLGHPGPRSHVAGVPGVPELEPLLQLSLARFRTKTMKWWLGLRVEGLGVPGHHVLRRGPWPSRTKKES